MVHWPLKNTCCDNVPFEQKTHLFTLTEMFRDTSNEPFTQKHQNRRVNSNIEVCREDSSSELTLLMILHCSNFAYTYVGLPEQEIFQDTVKESLSGLQDLCTHLTLTGQGVIPSQLPFTSR